MRSCEEVALVRTLADQGLNHSQIARVVGISRTTVRDWLAGRVPDFDRQELVDADPRPLLRGLLHSDGCRILNWVKGTPYPRYHFTNVSPDIREIFGRGCDALGVEWRQSNRSSLSVAKRGSVALLDEFVGPKR
jgi:hypothetical protein